MHLKILWCEPKI